MKNMRTEGKMNKSQGKTGKEREVEVLYQRLGNRWFAFSLIDNEMFVGSIPQDEVQPSKVNKRSSNKIAGNS